MSREDYIEVSERLQTFYETHPEGSLQSNYEIITVLDQPVVVVKAFAYRYPDDPRPGVGHAWEQVPGRTPFTKGSELMNGETSAWGRALAALGIAVHRGIASGHEVRQAEARRTEKIKATPADDPYYAQQAPANPPEYQPTVPHDDKATKATDRQIGAIFALMKPLGISVDEQKELINQILTVNGMKTITSTKDLTKNEASHVIGKLKDSVTVEQAAVP